MLYINYLPNPRGQRLALGRVQCNRYIGDIGRRRIAATVGIVVNLRRYVATRLPIEAGRSWLRPWSVGRRSVIGMRLDDGGRVAVRYEVGHPGRGCLLQIRVGPGVPAGL